MVVKPRRAPREEPLGFNFIYSILRFFRKEEAQFGDFAISANNELASPDSSR